MVCDADGAVRLVEVKSYPVDIDAVESIVTKYEKRSRLPITVIAPDFRLAGGRGSRHRFTA
jgi:hypothetical protein